MLNVMWPDYSENLEALECMLRKMFWWLVRKHANIYTKRWGGLGKEAGRSSYAQEAVPQRWVESQWREDGGPDLLDPARGDNNSNNKLRQEEQETGEERGEPGEEWGEPGEDTRGHSQQHLDRDKVTSDAGPINSPTLLLTETEVFQIIISSIVAIIRFSKAGCCQTIVDQLLRFNIINIHLHNISLT